VILRNQWNVQNLIFRDESRFALDGDKGYVWRRRGEYNQSAMAEQEKFPGGVMVFAALGPDFKSKLVVIEDSISAEKDGDVLRRSELFIDADLKFGHRRWFFMQDGATAHTTEENLKWLYALCKVLPVWPPKSQISIQSNPSGG
jgi:hypothetical protein